MLEKNIFPSDIKKLTVEQLSDLAVELRGKIIDVCAAKGGHLASSLGTVELCLALHYVLHTPDDLIAFDVGHQAYAHKLLTGRAKDFHRMREFGGISGFPNIKESPHDAFTAGHASNAVSLALGAATANRVQGKKHKVVAVVGDGSLTGGECFEALNHAGHLREDLTVVLNHNEMSISPSVGAIGKYLSEVQSSPAYIRARGAVDAFFTRHPKLGKVLVPRLKKFEEIVKGAFVPGLLFEEFGFRYFGPLDGHDLDLLIKSLRNITALPGPKIIHVVTKKGKGFVPAEEDSETFHSAGKFSKESGAMQKNASQTYTGVFGAAIVAMAEKDERVVALTAAMEGGTGLTPFRKRFPERLFDVGIAEQHLVSFAGGMNRQGLKPVIAVYSTFLQRAYDQLMQDITLQGFSPVICIDRAGLVGEDGPTHHGAFDIAFLRTVPEMVVMAPGYADDLTACLTFAKDCGKAVSIRYPKGKAFSFLPHKPVVMGRFEVVEQGRGVAIIALGSSFEQAWLARDTLRSKGIEPTLVNPRFVKPLDEECLRALAQTHTTVITVEEGTRMGGFGEAVADFYRRSGLSAAVSVETLAIDDAYVPMGAREALLAICGIDATAIVRAAEDAAKKVQKKVDGTKNNC
jgi:1-deoxy-D-xylulose-5-phosphate synthase